MWRLIKVDNKVNKVYINKRYGSINNINFMNDINDMNDINYICKKPRI